MNILGAVVQCHSIGLDFKDPGEESNLALHRVLRVLHGVIPILEVSQRSPSRLPTMIEPPLCLLDEVAAQTSNLHPIHQPDIHP